MIFKNQWLLCLAILIMISCKTEKDKLIVAYEDLYTEIINGNYQNLESKLDNKSREFYNKITNPTYLNIDSMIVLGNKYRLQYTLPEYLAFNGDKIKEGNPKEDFYRYLGAERISIFSFQDAYYVDKPKLKKGKENFVALIKEEMSVSKRSWVQFMGDDKQGYKLDLLYTLQLQELRNKKKNTPLRSQNKDKQSLEEFLRFYYWQNSGSNKKFDNEQLKLEQSMRDGRAELIQSYRERGLI